MIPVVHGVRSPVKREGAEHYVLVSLVSFAASVVLTRLFLQITGYPQLGSSELHIAHVLWGGLLLFIAALLPLILANRWAYNATAILSGVGVGLFIDEVGKFITQTNDYFYPPAAPIIYAFFLLTVLLYLRVRRQRLREPRSELYSILEGMTEILDHDLDVNERSGLQARLETIAHETKDPNLKRLADTLVNFLKVEDLHLVEPRMTRFHRLRSRMRAPLHILLYQPRLKAILVVALGTMGVLALIEFAILVWAIPAPVPAIEAVIGPLVTSGELRSAGDATWFITRVILEGMTGIFLIVSGGLLVVRRERTGIQLAILMLVVWLTVINLLVFYLDQFGAVVTTLFQFTVLLSLIYYRRAYLRPPATHPAPLQMDHYGDVQDE